MGLPGDKQPGEGPAGGGAVENQARMEARALQEVARLMRTWTARLPSSSAVGQEFDEMALILLRLSRPQIEADLDLPRER